MKKILIISLTKAPHLIELDHNLFIHASPMHDKDTLDDNKIKCSFNQSVKDLLQNKKCRNNIKGIIVFADCFSLQRFRPHEFPENILTTAINVDVYIANGGTNYYLVKTAPIPSGGALQVLDGGAKIVVESGDRLYIKSDTASSVDAWVSAVDAIST